MNSDSAFYNLIKVKDEYACGLHVECIDGYASFLIEIMQKFQRKVIAKSAIIALLNLFISVVRRNNEYDLVIYVNYESFNTNHYGWVWSLFF